MAANNRFFTLLVRSLASAGRVMLRHEVARDAAGISYFGLIALVPSIVVLVSLVDAMLGWVDLHGTVLQRIMSLFPGSRQFLRSNLNELTNPSTPVILSCFVVVIWCSSWILTFLENSVNRAWGISSQKSFWESRLRNVAFMMLGGCSLLSSAAITVFINTARARTTANASFARAHALLGWFWYFVLLGAGFVLAVLVFTLVFKWMPHRKVLWSAAFAGAVVTTIMWEMGSYIFARIVPFFDYQRIYGKMGAVVALLAWVYASNLIMLFGANFSSRFHSLKTEQELEELGIFDTKVRRFPL